MLLFAYTLIISTKIFKKFTFFYQVIIILSKKNVLIITILILNDKAIGVTQIKVNLVLTGKTNNRLFRCYFIFK